jgi:hypothetical protein
MAQRATYDGTFEGMQLALVAIEAGEPLRQCVSEDGCENGITLWRECPDCGLPTERIDATSLRADIDYDLMLARTGSRCPVSV